ncbi:hypothetical protein [Bifidobacterium tissieri]|uniref:hypothetical protein n=1 Tax=Bifidobacterium tissieri TaxID=1630162 RepID=UPI00123B62FA|nr:hypothetical protein [Bifidobacterium tissieri]KAA8830182.1 hypothetical protein EM849_10410 [Bifidobacterium tissieri]
MDDPLFQEFRAEGADMSLGDRLTDYANLFHGAFFHVAEQGPFATERELKHWLDWCLFYGRPRDEYPLAEEFREPQTSTCGESLLGVVRRVSCRSVPGTLTVS